MALTNLERFVAASPRPEAALEGLVDDPRALEILLQLFSTSQYFSELIIRDPASPAWLREGSDRRDRATLIAELWDAVREAGDEEAERLTLRRFRRRETLRVGYDDIVRGLPLELITLDLSHMADACVEAAYRLARRRAEARHGVPRGRDAPPGAVRGARARASSAARSSTTARTST